VLLSACNILYCETLVTFERTLQAIRQEAPGEHRIEVFLADGEHRDLDEGDAVVVAVQ
jgi:hypothetical protein